MGETTRATGAGVWVEIISTREKVADVAADANGRYRVTLPKGPRYLVTSKPMVGFTTPYYARATDKDMTLDFPLWGAFIEGFSFVDANGDGVKQAEEKTHDGRVLVTGEAGTEPREQVKVETSVAADGSFNVDLPLGDYIITAPDLSKQGLALAKPLRAFDIDWVTGKGRPLGERHARIDLRYFEPKADAAVEDVSISPAKDTYTVGDQIDVKVKLVNKGDVPGKLSVVMLNIGDAEAKLLSRSDNVTGSLVDFETVAKVLPGESLTVAMKLELTSTELEEIYPFARPFVGAFKDVDRKNQGLSTKKLIKVVEKSTAAPTSPSETTAPPTTTTTTVPAVAKAGNSGLASTGASPLGFIALGGLLLAAGAGVFLVARRRRS